MSYFLVAHMLSRDAHIADRYVSARYRRAELVISNTGPVIRNVSHEAGRLYGYAPDVPYGHQLYECRISSQHVENSISLAAAVVLFSGRTRKAWASSLPRCLHDYQNRIHHELARRQTRRDYMLLMGNVASGKPRGALLTEAVITALEDMLRAAAFRALTAAVRRRFRTSFVL